jgi:hypothetical protein
LTALLAAMRQKLARVLEVVTVHHLAQDAFGRDGRAIIGDDQGDLTLGDNDDRRFGEAILPEPVTGARYRPDNRLRR